MENTTTKAPVEPKESRESRRLRAKKGEMLETLVNLFFTNRSSLKDPEGQEADDLFVHFRNEWIAECKAFNKLKNRPFTLRGDAFKDQVERILKLEETSKKKIEESNKVKDYEHWMRRSRLWWDHPGRLFWYWLRSLGNHEKEVQLWKHYYIKHIIDK
jgi:hypothetical protein